MAGMGYTEIRVLKPEFRNSSNFLPQPGLEEGSSARDISGINQSIICASGAFSL